MLTLIFNHRHLKILTLLKQRRPNNLNINLTNTVYPIQKTYENANTHIIENDVIKSKTGNAMQNESISIMADPHIKGHHATITNLQGPLSMMFNVQIHKDLKLKGQQVKTFYVDKKI